MEPALVVRIIHVLGAMAWVGSLIFLAAVLFPYLRKRFNEEEYRELSVDVGRRFQIFGWVSIAVLATTGVANVYFRFGTLAFKTETDYGSALILKIGLFLLMVAFTLYHSWASLRSEGQEGGGLSAYGMLLTTVAIVVTAVYLGSHYV